MQENHSPISTEVKPTKITANSEKHDDPKYIRNVTAMTSHKKVQDAKQTSVLQTKYYKKIIVAVCRLGFSLLIDFSSQQNDIL